MKLRTFPVFLAFLAMGFGDAVGPFVSLAKSEFQLSNAVASLIPFVGFSMFGLLSIPVGLLQDQRGKKFVLLLGLAVALVGLLNATFAVTSFTGFLITILLLGAGAAILQVAGNPFMRDVSSEGKYSRNLSLAQFVKAIGSLSGPVIPVIAARWFGASWKVIFPIYAVAILVTLLAVSALHVTEKRDKDRPATLGSCLRLLGNGYVFAMVTAIFLYVGAEVSVSSGIPLFLKESYRVDVNSLGLLGTGLFFLALTIGRFSGGVILNWMSARKFFIVTSLVSIVALGGMFVNDRTVAVASFFLVGLGFANIFPLVFSLAVESLPQYTNELSGLMVTAIVGGAILPPVMGLVSDRSSVRIGFLVPLAAILYITWTAFLNVTPRAQEAK
ncbi:MAG TPA: MFS transporter [Bryobacteraceae bacterium]|jgi:fucose permease|nr:MFS transporter [Bryobacteraceae bacterium]